MGEVQMTISGTQNEILAMMPMAMGRGTALENAMMLDKTYEQAVVYVFNPDTNPTPGESEFSRFPIDAHIGEVGKDPRNSAEVQATKYAELWRTSMRTKLAGHETNDTFSTEIVPD